MTLPSIIQFDITLSLKVFNCGDLEAAKNEAIKQLMEKLKMRESQAILVIKENGVGSLNSTGLWNKYG